MNNVATLAKDYLTYWINEINESNEEKIKAEIEKLNFIQLGACWEILSLNKSPPFNPLVRLFPLKTDKKKLDRVIKVVRDIVLQKNHQIHCINELFEKIPNPTIFLDDKDFQKFINDKILKDWEIKRDFFAEYNKEDFSGSKKIEVLQDTFNGTHEGVLNFLQINKIEYVKSKCGLGDPAFINKWYPQAKKILPAVKKIERLDNLTNDSYNRALLIELLKDTAFANVPKIPSLISTCRANIKEVLTCSEAIDSAKTFKDFPETAVDYDLDRTENDGPLLVNLLQELKLLESGELASNLTEKGKTFSILSSNDPTWKIKNGEAIAAKGKLKLGNRLIPFAWIARAMQGHEQVLEDRVGALEIQMPDGNNAILATANDGTQSCAAAAYFHDNVHRVLANVLNALPVTTSKATSLKIALVKTYQILLKEWKKVAEKNGAKASQTTITWNLLQQLGDNISGVLLNTGNSRAFVLRSNGCIERLCGKEGGLYAYILKPGEYLFTTSKGLTQNGTPQEFNRILKNRLMFHKKKNPKLKREDVMNLALKDLIDTSLNGKEEDRNPLLVYNPIRYSQCAKSLRIKKLSQFVNRFFKFFSNFFF